MFKFLLEALLSGIFNTMLPVDKKVLQEKLKKLIEEDESFNIREILLENTIFEDLLTRLSKYIKK